MKVVAVRLALVGAMPMPAEVFVADVPRRGRGQLFDDLATRLCSEAAFVPVRWSGRVRMLAKHAIAWIAVRRHATGEIPSLDFSDEPSELTLFDREHRVEIEVGSSNLIGTLLDSSPADCPRLIDHLNRSGRFLRLWTSDEHYLVNAAHVIAVTELGETR
jgi:hypothetical protein